MKKSLGMKNKLETMKNQVQTLLDENKVEEAKAKMEEVKTLKAAIEVQEELEKEEEASLIAESDNNNDELDPENSMQMTKNKVKENANCIRAMIKKASGKQLTEAENALLLPSTGTPDGENGESFILPKDISTLIHKKIREYRSLRDAVGYMPAGALTGSFPVENFETVEGLIDFTDGTEGTESEDIKFKNVSYSLN